MSNVLPMPVVFEACLRALDSIHLPLHYRVLTERALALLGVDAGDVDMTRQIEDVREKLLCARSRDTFYVPDPHCLAARQSWFASDQLAFNSDRVVVAGSLTASISGAAEALLRAPHMIQKNPFASEETVARARARGQILEHHISAWFSCQWPTFYRPPANHRRYTMVADHDFVLDVHGTRLRVDVVGPSSTRGWDPPDRKPKTDLHVLCEMREHENVCLWEGVARGTDYRPGILPVWSTSPLRMIVWLNARAAGVDYAACVEALRGDV